MNPLHCRMKENPRDGWSWFEVPAIAHFFHIFKNSFGLVEFDIEDFEEALFLDTAENCSSFLPELVVQLLRGLYKTKDVFQVTIENYLHYLQDLLEYRYVTIAGKDNPLKDRNFKDLSTRQKVDLLFDMCNWRIELEDAMELTKDLEAEEMRVMPVGCDKQGYQYWYFYGTRLYREKCHADEEKDEIPDNKEVKKSKLKTKKRGRKRKVYTTTKSGRSVKPRLDFGVSDNEKDDDEEEEEEEQKKVDEDTAKSANVNIDEKPVLRPCADNEWMLICSSVQQWDDIVSLYKASSDKNEKILLTGLRDLNEVMPDIFEEKEKALERKLLAMAPRRSSDRIHIKIQVREEEQRRKEQRRILKNELKAKEVEKRQKELEKEKEIEREQRYLNRERNLELRAQRAKQREEQKLVAENPELAKEMQLTRETKQYNTLKLEVEGEEDDKYLAMNKVLEILKDHDDAWPFLESVKEEEAPQYYEYIQNPMDLSKIAEKVENKIYKDKSEFEDDIYLMFDNCETYNGTLSSFNKLATKVKKAFEKQMKKEFPAEKLSNDDEYEQALEPKKNTVKIKTEKVPKEKHFRKSKELSGLQAFKRNTAILTPEFAHAQILQAQAHVLQNSQGGISSQILPKLGISQDILARLTPAQMQLMMMQLRSGVLAPKVVSHASVKSPLSTPSSGISSWLTQSTPKCMATQVTKPKQHLSISQFIQSHKSSDLKIGSTSAFNLQNFTGINDPGKLVTASKNQYVPQNTSFNNKFIPTHILPKSSKLAAQALPLSVLSSPGLKPNALVTTIPNSNMVIYNQSTASPISGGHLLIPNKKNFVNQQPKLTGSPILNQTNVRYIGQPNGKLQKVVYLPTNIRASSTPKPILNKTMAQLTPLQQSFFSDKKSNTSPKITRPVHNLAVKNTVPVFLNAQGIPLKVVNPSSLSATSLTFSGHILPTLTNNSKIISSSSATISAPPTSQHLQGLKKAVEQVAAVTQINAKLQNHLQNKDTVIPPTNKPQYVNNFPAVANKVFIKTARNNGKGIHNHVNLKLSADPVALSRTFGINNNKIVSKHNTQTMAMAFSDAQSIQPKKASSMEMIQPGISFILTSNGLVSVSLPLQVQNRVNVSTIPSTQNIITSKMPVHILTSRSTILSGITTSSAVSINTIPAHHGLSNALLSPVVTTSATLSSSMAFSSVPAVVPVSTTCHASTSVFIKKMPANILLSRPIPSSKPATITNTTTLAAPVFVSKPTPQNTNSTTPSIFRTGNIVSPEKLRDAEALLGLINPMHHSPIKQTSSSDIVSPRALVASAGPKMQPSSSIPLPSNPVKQVSIFQSSALQENNHLKINLPNLQSSSSSNLPSTLKLPQMMLPSDTNKTKNTAPLISSATSGHKMVVNASQLKKLHEEGKVVVTPSGQMFLMTGTQHQKPAANGKS